jgi:cytochrome b6-f complex iron-sulfur subunit
MTELAVLTHGMVLVIAVLVAMLVFALVLGLQSLRAREAFKAHENSQEATEGETPIPVPLPKGPTRRDFLRRAWVASLAVFAAEFGAATLAYLWPTLKGGFGSIINAGTVSDIKQQIQSTGQPFYLGSGRFYLVSYDGTGKDAATQVDYVAQGVLEEGLMPIYQKCAHLGCRVPFCTSSQWFECPCHGSKYNEAGEYQAGPAPTGLWRFKIKISGGNVFVDTSQPVTPPPPRGTDTTHQTPAGPFCVSG